MYSLRTPEYGILGPLLLPPPPPHPENGKNPCIFLLRQEYTKNRKNTAQLLYRIPSKGNTDRILLGNTTKNTSQNTEQNTRLTEYRLVVQNTAKNTSENTAQNT